MSAKRVLLIDDEVALSTVIQVCLETLALLKVIKAESGQEGLLKAVTEKPDVILLDVMMPDINGLVVLEELKNNPLTKTIPVILLTAKMHLCSQYKQLDIVGVIVKPFEPLRLANQVVDMLGWQEGVRHKNGTGKNSPKTW